MFDIYVLLGLNELQEIFLSYLFVSEISMVLLAMEPPVYTFSSATPSMERLHSLDF